MSGEAGAAIETDQQGHCPNGIGRTRLATRPLQMRQCLGCRHSVLFSRGGGCLPTPVCISRMLVSSGNVLYKTLSAGPRLLWWPPLYSWRPTLTKPSLTSQSGETQRRGSHRPIDGWRDDSPIIDDLYLQLPRLECRGAGAFDRYWSGCVSSHIPRLPRSCNLSLLSHSYCLGKRTDENPNHARVMILPSVANCLSQS